MYYTFEIKDNKLIYDHNTKTKKILNCEMTLHYIVFLEHGIPAN